MLYMNLLTSGKLNKHLAEVDERAEEIFFQLVKQFAEKEGGTEELKAEKQMEWVGRINNIRNRVTEIINAEVISIATYQIGISLFCCFRATKKHRISTML